MTTPNDRYLTLDRLRAADRRRRRRHRRDGVHRHAGPAAGQAPARRATSSTSRSRHGTEGCNYLLAVDVDMNTVDGYAISSWERGYGDMEFVPDWDTLRLLPHLPGTAMVQCDLVWLDHAPVLQSPRTILQAPARPGRRARAWSRSPGTELEFIAFDTSYEDAHHRRLARPDAGQPVQRRLLDPRHQPGRAAAARHPQPHVRRRARRRGRQGRVQLRPARDRLPLRRRAGHRRQPQRLQDRRQGDRRPARPGDHVHGEVRRARGQLLPHPPVAARRRRRRRLLGRRRAHAALRPASSPACWPRCATSRCSTRRTSTPTSGSPPARSRRPRSPGASTTAPARSAWSGTARAPGWRTACPAATSTPTSRSPAMLAGGLHGIENELELEDELVGNAYDSDKPHVPHTLRDGPRRCSPPRTSPGRRSATRSSTTTSTWPTSSSRRSTPPSPTGSSPAPSRGCEPDDDHRSINPSTGAERSREVALRPSRRGDRRRHRARPGRVPAWRAVAPGERARLLRAFAAVVDAHVEELARLEVENAGHTIGNARWEAGNVRDCLNYYSAAPERLFGRQIPVAGGVDVTFHEPLGVVGVIVPWNFPMPIAGWGFAPALAAGNTVVLKPAEITPLTAIRIGELALEAGLPEGVFTVLPGKGSVVGQRFVTHPLVRKVCFTGSTEVGKQIMAGCADQVKRVTLELGGKSANIVFADADVARGRGHARRTPSSTTPARTAARARGSSSSGRRTTSSSAASRRRSAAMKVVDPAQDDSEMGPMVSARQRDSVQAYIDGATVAFQGRAPSGDGYWLPPTVVESTSTDEPVWREEVFGPVVAVMAFDDEEEAVALANDTEYGLSGLDLHPRPRPGAARLARRRGRQPQRELALQRPLLDAVRRVQAVGPRPRARPRRPERLHRGEERLLLRRELEEERQWQDASRARSPSSPEAAPGSGWRPYAASSRRARRSSSATSTTPRGARGRRGARRRRRGDVRRGRRDRQGPGRRAVPDGQGHLRLGRHRLQQRRHQPARGRLDPRHRPRGLGPGAARST